MCRAHRRGGDADSVSVTMTKMAVWITWLKMLWCVRRLASAAVSAVGILESTASGGQVDGDALRQQGAWVRATLALELLNKHSYTILQYQQQYLNAQVSFDHHRRMRLMLASRGYPHTGSADVSMLAVQRALDMMERTCEADALWSSQGDGGRWARKLSNQARSVSALSDSIGVTPGTMAERSVQSASIRDGAVSAPPIVRHYGQHGLDQKAVHCQNQSRRA